MEGGICDSVMVLLKNITGGLLPTGRLLRAVFVLNVLYEAVFVTSSHLKDQSDIYIYIYIYM